MGVGGCTNNSKAIYNYMDLSNLLSKYKKDNFKITEKETLFELDWNMYKQGRCPICFNKLRLIKDNTMVICKGKKHVKPFVKKL